MKFNCGPTIDDLARESAAKVIEGTHYLQSWHRHFALLPVRISRTECRWLEVVERKGTFVGYAGIYLPEIRDEDWTWEYRARV